LQNRREGQNLPAAFCFSFKDIPLSQDGRPAPMFRQRRTDVSLRDGGNQPILNELISVLKPHARGLRRWSVMRAMRENRKRQSRDIPQKFEDDIERIFRRFCAEDGGACTADNAPFYRPRETAGEVWALHTDRAEALLSGEPLREPSDPLEN
jgi:hypothetical protein